MREYIAKYLREKGLEFKDSGSEQFLLKTCQFCGDSKFHHFYMNYDEGLWDCVVKGGLVWTSEGLVPIEKVNIGDKVLTKSGLFRRVTDTFHRRRTGKIHQFKIDSAGLSTFEVTGDHRIFNSKGAEVRANNFNKEMSFLHPKRRKFLTKKLPCPIEGLSAEDGFWFFVGWFIADGYFNVKANTIQIAYDGTDRVDLDTALRYQKFFKKFGINSFIYKDAHSKQGRFLLYSTKLGRWLVEHCGGDSFEKRLPEMCLNTKREAFVLKGYCFGDGHQQKDKEVFQITTVSETLAKQIYWIWCFDGKFPTTRVFAGGKDKKGIYRSRIWNVFFRTGKNKRNMGRHFKSVKVRQAKDELVYDLTVEKDPSFTVGSVAVHNCKKCQQSGHFNQFRAALGDAEIDLGKFEVKEPGAKVKKKEYKTLTYTLPLGYASRLWKIDEGTRKYLLEDRGLKEEVLRKYKIGSTGKGISIPIYENDVLVNVRYRRDPKLDGKEDVGPKYSQEKGCRAALFNGDVLKEPLREVYLCEGEFDALQLIQRGITNTLSVTLGAGYFRKDWVDKLKDVKTIYLVFDRDEAGLEGMKKAIAKLGTERCKMILLPRKEGRKKTDITNYFVDDGYGKADFEELVKTAKVATTVDDDAIKHISEFEDEMRKNLLEGDYFGEASGYRNLDEVMGGFRRGRLIIVAGITSVGKTSWGLNVALNMANRKLPIFFLSLEMPPIDIVKKVIMLEAKLTNTDLKEIEDPSKTLEEVDKTLASFKGEDGLPIYLYNGSGTVKFSVLAECARAMKENYNCQCLFIDHLHYFVQNYGNLTSETSKLVRWIKQLAIQLDIPIVLLAHLNRGGRANKRKGMYVPSLSDLRDSGAIEQDADQVLFVCRDSESEAEEDRKKSFLKLAKNRDGSAGRSISMEFDENITTFIEAEEGVDYEEVAKKEGEEMSKEVEIDESELPF